MMRGILPHNYCAAPKSQSFADTLYQGAMRLRMTILFVVLVCIAFMSVVAVPNTAFAKSYSMPRVNIEAQVGNDASLHVVEQRSFDFDGSFSAVWWDFGGLPENGKMSIASVSIGSANTEGELIGELTELDDVPFSTEWRSEGGPSKDAYSYDLARNTLYVFFSAHDENKVIQIDYTITNAAQAYADVADLYWKYVGSGWAESSKNVTMNLWLPVPEGQSVVAGDNVKAWGHGPIDGTVSIHEDGSITYQVSKVESGQFAEAHVLFPVEWLTNLSPEAASAHEGQYREQEVLTQESLWADQANKDRIFSLLFIISIALICVLLLVWALRAYYKYGKEHTPDFTEEYWRDVPDPRIHPAVIGRLWRWDRQSQDDFIATIMHLAHVGAVRIDSGSYPKYPGSSIMVEDCYITRLPAASSIKNPIDQMALETLFGQFAGGADALWFDTIKEYGKKHPQQFLDAMAAWQGMLSAETNRYDFFEERSNRYQGYLVAASLIVVGAAVLTFVLTENFVPLIFLIPTAIALFVIANYMPRRSVFGNNTVAKCKALRNWLRDFSLLDERPPTDVKVWGEYMVYAYLFGVADRAISQLRQTQPQLFEYSGEYGPTYMPWWFWYIGGYSAGGRPMSALSTSFAHSITNTVHVANSAISAASGNFSSGGGFGGGFSGGGGGGFGGGGGGAR